MKRFAFTAMASLAAASLAVSGALVLGSGADAATSNGGYRIMPLGDSITLGFGSSGGGYRPTLWRNLTGAGATVDLVGSVSDNPLPSGLGDGDHEGHSGWTIQQVLDNVTRWQQSARPQTILLHIGTNDLTNRDTANAPGRLEQLVDRILANDPSVNLFVASIIRMSYASGTADVQTYNSRIPALVSARVAKGFKVYNVDMFSALGTSDLGDAVHPNNNGYVKMGNAWWAALQAHPEAYGKGTGPTPTTTSPTTSAPPQTGVVLESTFEGGQAGGWTGRASEQLSLVSGGHSGSSALSVTGRTASWNGASRDVTGTLRPGSTYYLAAWVRLAAGESATTANLSIQRTSGGTTSYEQVASAVAATADGWTRLAGTYTVPADVTAVSVYAELASDTASFLLDDVVASTTPITTEPTTTSPTPTTTTPTPTTTKPSPTKTTKTGKVTTVKKCKTGKNGKKTCKTVTKTRK
ncbi:MAG: carbohydrate binding domain-containing protein [Kineosporiaceae bacterium]